MSCITFVVGTNAASLQSLTSLVEDAMELDRLMEQPMSSIPAAFLNKGSLNLCQWIDDCCEAGDRSKVISILTSIMRTGGTDLISPEDLNTCTSVTARKKIDQSCPSLQYFFSTQSLDKDQVDDPIRKQFMTLLIEYRASFVKMIRSAAQICDENEGYGFFCLSDKKLVQSCAAKLVQFINNYTSDEYYMFMTKLK